MATTLTQPAVFLAMLYAGVVMGMVYDLFRMIRRLFCNRIVDAIVDALFVIAALAIAAFAMLIATGGAMRFYSYVGLLTGFALEQISISHLFFRCWHTLRDKWRKRKKTA